MVRLRTHPHSGVEVPVRLTIHQPVTEGYCVVATQGGEAAGGELPVRNRADAKQRQRELDSAGRWDELVMAMRSPCRSPRLGKRIPARAGKASGTASVR